MTLEEFKQICRERTEKHTAVASKPEEDPPPFFVTMRPGREDVAVIDPNFMETEEHKKILAAKIVDFLKEQDILYAAFVACSWASNAKKGEDITRPSEDPNKREVMIVMGGDREGNYFMEEGLIERSEEDPPKVVSWKKYPEVDSFGGIFGDAMVEGLSQSRFHNLLDSLKEDEGLWITGMQS